MHWKLGVSLDREAELIWSVRARRNIDGRDSTGVWRQALLLRDAIGKLLVSLGWTDPALLW